MASAARAHITITSCFVFCFVPTILPCLLSYRLSVDDFFSDVTFDTLESIVNIACLRPCAIPEVHVLQHRVFLFVVGVTCIILLFGCLSTG